ncbi:uncharacterized protein BT62DRAFT_1008705 [Guyanagaster necrorhizus]|uniref:Uncharacterized protein n=1 Tax=Guyanagaster necrorhizus TaxID=856835 RepID=A0A9P7VMN6_9AGAR|nr:uncharacterized protein BT62DRAFT_1008705 [Guyanagaster necrorhizus MCA 3950]KAG7444016.1 hypothetical protein BT62DRAFT_1008705 [Guyanagaster necrorhizus MCA 3950]
MSTGSGPLFDSDKAIFKGAGHKFNIDNSVGVTNSPRQNTDVNVNRHLMGERPSKQDDCIAIDPGYNIVFSCRAACIIKVEAEATSSMLSGITYSCNTINGIIVYGVLISQSYPDEADTPGTSSPISCVSFTGKATSQSLRQENTTTSD